jgi:hypothetical protein
LRCTAGREESGFFAGSGGSGVRRAGDTSDDGGGTRSARGGLSGDDGLTGVLVVVLLVRRFGLGGGRGLFGAGGLVVGVVGRLGLGLLLGARRLLVRGVGLLLTGFGGLGLRRAGFLVGGGLLGGAGFLVGGGLLGGARLLVLGRAGLRRGLGARLLLGRAGLGRRLGARLLLRGARLGRGLGAGLLLRRARLGRRLGARLRRGLGAGALHGAVSLGVGGRRVGGGVRVLRRGRVGGRAGRGVRILRRGRVRGRASRGVGILRRGRVGGRASRGVGVRGRAGRGVRILGRRGDRGVRITGGAGRSVRVGRGEGDGRARDGGAVQAGGGEGEGGHAGDKDCFVTHCEGCGGEDGKFWRRVWRLEKAKEVLKECECRRAVCLNECPRNLILRMRVASGEYIGNGTGSEKGGGRHPSTARALCSPRMEGTGN